MFKDRGEGFLNVFLEKSQDRRAVRIKKADLIVTI
ncbi:MAG: hypothetical protein ACI90Q_002116 [Nonlabens sp.]